MLLNKTSGVIVVWLDRDINGLRHNQCLVPNRNNDSFVFPSFLNRPSTFCIKSGRWSSSGTDYISVLLIYIPGEARTEYCCIKVYFHNR